MNPRGIPIAQIDSSTELDSKLQKLARRLSPLDYYAAFGSYMSIVLRAWGTASRVPDPDLLDLIPPGIIDQLVGVGLLDSEGAIPCAVFDRWPGAVLEAREERAQQLASIASEGGKARARGPRDSAGRLVSPAVTAGDPAVTAGHPAVSPLLSSPSRSTTEEGDETGVGVQGKGAWPYLYPEVVALTGKHVAQGKFANDLCELAEQAGPDTVIAAMKAVAEKMTVKPDIRALAFGVSNALRLPPSGRDVAHSLATARETADTARKEAERREAASHRRQRLLDEARAADQVPPEVVQSAMSSMKQVLGK